MNRKFFLLFFLILLSFLHISYAQPPLPMIVAGNVKIDNKLAPPATLVTAKIDGKVRAEYTLQEEGKYILVIPGNETDEGKTINIYVNNKLIANLTWSSGKIVENFNLEVKNSKQFSFQLLLFLGIVIPIFGLITFISLKKKKRIMHRKRLLWPFSLIFLMLFLHLVKASPTFHTFRGYVFYNNTQGLVSVEDGKLLIAYIDDEVRGNTTINNTALYPYVLIVKGDTSEVGKEIKFKLDDLWISQ